MGKAFCYSWFIKIRYSLKYFRGILGKMPRKHGSAFLLQYNFLCVLGYQPIIELPQVSVLRGIK